jgi:surface protein
MPMLRLLAALVFVGLTAACDRSSPTAVLDETGMASIAAVGTPVVETEHFYFLPPLVRPSQYAGRFDSTYRPSVVITRGTTVIATLPVEMQAAAETYRTVWHTREHELTSGVAYRLSVMVSDFELGAIEVVPTQGAANRNPAATTAVVIQNGRSLPIQFRIEEGAYRPPFYLAANGKTIMCPQAAIGETGVVDGVTYTKRDRKTLDQLIAARDFAAVSTTCTSSITAMDSLFVEVPAALTAVPADARVEYLAARRMLKGVASGPTPQFTVIDYDVTSWDVSNVTDMRCMFCYQAEFNQDISGWDVSNVTNMAEMFSHAYAFNQPIGDWDVSNVTEMWLMFHKARSFNQPIGRWDVSQVSNMNGMFDDATSFNQPIGDWDVSNVEQMNGMFSFATAFNQPIGNWDMRKVVNLAQMFTAATSFNQPLADWDLSSVEEDGLYDLFLDATSFNQPIGTWRWGPTVYGLRGMFSGATSFNQDISGWNMTGIGNVESMFLNASAFNRDLSSWCLSLVPLKPEDFDTGATAWVLPRPNFGECATARRTTP